MFNVTFECFKPLPGNLDWRVIYLSSADNGSSDQVIDKFTMNDLQPGCMQFSIESACPDFSKTKIEDVLGMGYGYFLGTAAVMISVAYEGQEFWRVGFYVINQILGEGDLKWESISRKIITESPRVMRFDIEWIKHEGSSEYNGNLLQQTI